MSEIIETNDADRTTEYKTFVTPNFHEIAEEIAKHASYGWIIEPNRPPLFNFFLYEVHMIKNADTIALAKSHFDASLEGRDVMTKEKRQENMAKARAARAAKKDNKGDGDEGEVQ
jgi:hypothetical protein